jgi:cobalt-zinc-cadmium efflux system membrane fusion protein
MRKKTVLVPSIIFISAGLWLGWNYFRPAAADNRADVATPKCEIHGISLELCSRCNPELIPNFKTSGDWCAEHNLPESQCDLCVKVHNHDDDPHDVNHHEHEHGDYPGQPENRIVPDAHSIHETLPAFTVFFPENAIHCATDNAVIQFASIQTVERAGLTVRPVAIAESAPVIEAPAEIVFNEANTVVLSTTLPALVSEWLVEPGQTVRTGDILARLNVPGLPRMKAEYLEAHAARQLAAKRFERQKELHGKGLVSDSEFEEIATEFRLAEARLVGQAGMLTSAGLSEHDLEIVKEGENITQVLNLYAPRHGVIIDRIAVLGQFLAEGQPLAVIGDPDSFWIEARMRENALDKIRVGDNVEFSADGYGFKRCIGRVIWISRFLDKDTRSAIVRAEVVSTTDRLHAGEYGRVLIGGGTLSPAVIVPRDAVQWEGCCNVVFVKETIDRFRPRKVKISPGDNGYYRIVDGLAAGEEIVVNGSYLLKTELKKGSIGAGCAGH